MLRHCVNRRNGADLVGYRFVSEARFIEQQLQLPAVEVGDSERLYKSCVFAGLQSLSRRKDLNLLKGRLSWQTYCDTAAQNVLAPFNIQMWRNISRRFQCGFTLFIVVSILFSDCCITEHIQDIQYIRSTTKNGQKKKSRSHKSRKDQLIINKISAINLTVTLLDITWKYHIQTLQTTMRSHLIAGSSTVNSPPMLHRGLCGGRCNSRPRLLDRNHFQAKRQAQRSGHGDAETLCKEALLLNFTVNTKYQTVNTATWNTWPNGSSRPDTPLMILITM